MERDIDIAALGAGLAGGLAGAYARPFGSAWVGFAAGSVTGTILVGLARAASESMAAPEPVVWDMGMATAADTRAPPPSGG